MVQSQLNYKIHKTHNQTTHKTHYNICYNINTEKVSWCISIENEREGEWEWEREGERGREGEREGEGERERESLNIQTTIHLKHEYAMNIDTHRL